VKLAWLTDPHVNFVPAATADALAAGLRGRADAVLMTGDIGEARSFVGLIERFAAASGLPVWFVLGNHDAYGGSIAAMRAAARALPGWLSAAEPIAIGGGTFLAGHDSPVHTVMPTRFST
jgi:3',5'-cyclic AMP phosphodiesterase CpdA